MRQHDRPWFREGLKHLLESGNERQLEDLLAQEFARELQVKRAAHLYMRCVYHALLGDENFLPILTAIHALRDRENTETLLEKLEVMSQAINGLIGLPKNLITSPERPLPLKDGHLDPQLSALLLDARYRLVDYGGKAFEQALDDLCTWAKQLEGQSPPLGLHLYTAAGGSGKTRLLLEAALKLREEGWWTGFIGVDNLSPQQAEILMQDCRPTFIVVDYLEMRSQAVLNLLKAMAQKAFSEQTRKAPLALVLAERHYPHWLKQETQRGSDPSYSGLVELYHLLDFKEHPLPSFTDPQERAEFFRTARETLKSRLNLPGGSVDYPPEYLPERPLYLLLLALHAAEGLLLKDPRNEKEILEHTWQREETLYKQILQSKLKCDENDERLSECVKRIKCLRILATLGLQFESIEKIAGFLETNFPAIEGPHEKDTINYHWLAKQVSLLFTSEGETVPPIRPDPLADYVLWNALTGKEGRTLLRMALPEAQDIAANPEGAGKGLRTLFEVLGRLFFTRDWIESKQEESKPKEGQGQSQKQAQKQFAVWQDLLTGWMKDLPAKAAGDEKSQYFWLEVSQNIPVLWGEIGLIAAQKLQKSIPPGDPAALALSLNNLAIRYSELNRREEALQAAEEARDLYRQLAQANPQAFTPDLAMSLNNLANIYSELNRREEALQAAEEAVTLLIPFFVRIPEGFFPWMSVMVRVLESLEPRAPLVFPAEICQGLQALSHHPHPQIAETARKILQRSQCV